MKEYILFDLDGTLTDPKTGITKCVQYALKEFGIDEPDLDRLEPFIGPPLRDSFMDFYGFTPEQAEAAVEKYRERFSETGIFENEIYTGIPQMLKALNDNGLKLAVASSKPKVYVDRILKHFDIEKYFKAVVGSELDGTRENKEEVVTEALRQLFGDKPVEPDKVYMVGDRKYDIEGARALHIESVAVSYGYGGQDELKEARADYIVRSVSELRKFLLREAEAKAGEQLSGTTMFQKIWVMLYAFLMFMIVRSIALYAMNWLFINLGMNFEGEWMRLLFTRNDAGEIDGFTGNASTVMTAIGYIAGTIPILSTARTLINKTAEENRLSYIKPEPPSGYILMALATAGSVIGLNVMFELAGITNKSDAYRAVVEDQYSAYFLIGLICYGIVTPIAEELMFRGIIYNYLKRFMNVKMAFFAAAALFGFYHMNAVQGVYGFIMGLLIAYAYEYFGDFRAPVAVHMISNIISYCLSYTVIAVTGLISVPVCIVMLAVGIICLGVLNKRKSII